MTFQLKEGNFSLFKNKRKETPNHPDFSGDINIDGEVRWISMWVKTDKNGNTYYSGSTKKKTGKQYSGPTPEPARSSSEIDEDTIPF